jgi:hypothetical protein
MDGLSTLTVADWIVLRLLACMAVFVALGTYSIRREIQAEARIKARHVRLKTTETQRRQWRHKGQPQELLDALDDIDILLKHLSIDDTPARQDHKEAVRLSWGSRHIPVRTFLLGGLLLVGVLSAIQMVVAVGPSNPIP